MFKGTSYYADNTPLFLTDVGEVDSMSVLCITDLEGCCLASRQGEWIFPNGSRVKNGKEDEDTYRSRSSMAVELHRRSRTGATYISATGQYCCELATTDNRFSTICVILSNNKNYNNYNYSQDLQ